MASLAKQHDALRVADRSDDSAFVVLQWRLVMEMQRLSCLESLRATLAHVWIWPIRINGTADRRYAFIDKRGYEPDSELLPLRRIAA